MPARIHPIGPIVAVLLVLLSASCTVQPPAGTAQFDGKSVPTQYLSWVIQAGGLCPEVSPQLIAAQIEAESNWNPRAVSPVGAQGLSQFMPGTWDTFGQDGDPGNGVEDPFDPVDAIMAQGRYDCHLAGEIKRMQNGTWGSCSIKANGGGTRSLGPPPPGAVVGDVVELMLAAYNAGPCRVRQYGGIPPFKETRGYVAKIMTLKAKYEVLSVADQVGVTGGVGEIGEGAGFGGLGARAVQIALQQVGLPYVWGGGSANGPDRGSRAPTNAPRPGFDCSGLVLFAFAQASAGQPGGKRMTISPPANSQAKMGIEIPRAEIQPGDVIAFRERGNPAYHHIGIYVGNGQMVHAPQTGQNIKVSPLGVPYYENQIWMIRRYGSQSQV